MATSNRFPIYDYSVKRLIARLKQLQKNIFSTPKSFFAFLGITVSFFIIVFFTLHTKNNVHGFDSLITVLFIKLFVVLLSLLAVVIYTFKISGWFSEIKFNNGFKQIHLQNSLGETPLLLSEKSNSDKQFKYTFDASGLSLEVFQKSQSEIESALNITIQSIQQGCNMNEIIISCTHGRFTFPDYLYLNNSMVKSCEDELVLGTDGFKNITMDLNTYPHILLGGSTGSGKTQLLKTLLYQCILRNYLVFIADFKGGVDFNRYWSTHASVITEQNDLIALLERILDELSSRKKLFLNLGYVNIHEYNTKHPFILPHIVIAVDEIAELLDKRGLSKEQKEPLQKIESYLSTIARQGRAFGIHLILATQRPDADILSGQIKNNIPYKACGRADEVLSMIVLDNTNAFHSISSNDIGIFINQDGEKFKAFLIPKGEADVS